MQVSSKFQLMKIWIEGTHCAGINYLSNAFLRDCHGLQKGLHKLFSHIINIDNITLSIFQMLALITHLIMLCLVVLWSLFNLFVEHQKRGVMRPR